MASASPKLLRSHLLPLAKFAWGVLAYNLLVIVWGAYVRASGSGAGCGRHWPLCNGEVIPRAKSVATIVEVSHRVSSGFALIAVVVMMVWALRTLPKGHRARRASTFTTVFMFAEALVGAGLVLFELVAHDASMKRGLSMILHLGNTFFLLGALTLTAWTLTFENARTVPNASEAAPTARRSAARSGGGGAAYRGRQLGATNRQALRSLRLWWLRGFALFPLLAVLFLGGTGAIAALGDTLFPAVSLSEGLRQDLSPLAHVFLRLRLLHPFIALATGAIVFASATMVRALSTSQLTRRLARVVTVVFATQFSIGLLNVTLLAPIPMQLLHLLMADATWIVLVLMGWEALYGQPFRDAARVHANDDVNDGDEAPAVATTRADAVM